MNFGGANVIQVQLYNYHLYKCQTEKIIILNGIDFHPPIDIIPALFLFTKWRRPYSGLEPVALPSACIVAMLVSAVLLRFISLICNPSLDMLPKKSSKISSYH